MYFLGSEYLNQSDVHAIISTSSRLRPISSVSSRYMALFDKAEDFPEEGYHGQYIHDLAKEIAQEFGDKFINMSIEERQQQLAGIALEKMINLQKKNMSEYRVSFDTWFEERSYPGEPIFCIRIPPS